MKMHELSSFIYGHFNDPVQFTTAFTMLSGHKTAANNIAQNHNKHYLHNNADRHPSALVFFFFVSTILIKSHQMQRDDPSPRDDPVHCTRLP
jgi:hypothetical protein